MEISRDIMQRCCDLLDQGKKFALCTVVTARGSVPGRPGAKMIVLPDGRQFGTVGGAGLEEKTRRLAIECIAAGRSAMRHFDLAYYKPQGLDSLCGGSVEIMVEYMAGPPHLLICGGGHVGLEVARLCDQLGYGYSVVDDRPEFVARDRFPGARGLYHALPADFFPDRELGAFSHVLLVGYSHQIDTDVLFHCVRGFTGWIGVISSRLKRKKMFERLRERGVDEGALNRVEAPVGLAIGAESPAEIAVSILGGVIKDHKQRNSTTAAQENDHDDDHDQQPQQEQEQAG